jgi:quercetin dioxygenase-like cupin family protein
MEASELVDQAALYALDVLEDHEQEWFEEALAGASDLQGELAAFQAAVAAIPYSAPLLPMAADLKGRLFERIGEEVSRDVSGDGSGGIQDGADHGGENQIGASVEALWEQANRVTWQDYRPTPGTFVGVLKVDEESREVQCFVKSPGRARFPAHRHATDEEIVVLQGDLVLDGKVYWSGDRIRSEPGTVHQPETLNGCVIFLISSLDDEILVDR